MAQLKTKILLRNDSTQKWLENSTKILSKGEIGIEFLEDGSTKFKIGDGIKTWAELSYAGGEGISDVEDIQASINDLTDTTTDLAETINTLEENIYTKEEINGLISGVYHYKGTVSSYSDLPTEGQSIGDVYNIEQGSLANGIDPGDNVAWNGTDWDVLSGVVDLSAYALKSEVVVKEEGKRLITDAEAEKLEKINENAEANLIEIIKLNDVALEIVDKIVNIPVASDSLGVVKSSDGENEVGVSSEGIMSVNSLNVKKLVQTEGEELILDCGSAAN